ncbi:putative transposable element [Trichonephila clavipes]|nr:putative transposable element [Trichonephila clavipes]
MITNFFIPVLNNHDVQELWFQQDGATCHIARATIDLLKDTLGERLISRFGPVNWPPRSCDLTPLDYFLWVYVKSLVYADKPQTLDHLEDNIRRVIADIRPQILEKRSGIGGEGEYDIEELVMGHEDELTIEGLQEILNEEHQETQRNVSPSKQEEDERGPMPTSATKDILKKWEAARTNGIRMAPKPS